MKIRVNSITVDNEGVITITPHNLHGIKPTDNYTLTPKSNNNQLVWSSSGGGVDEGYAQ